MGRIVQAGGEEEEGRRAVERAEERVERGDMEGALWLLQRAQRLHPRLRGVAEIQAVAQVCLAATWNPCACSSAASSPQWYRILMVNEKADLGAIKKRYRQLALLLHPDKNKHSRAEEAFKLVSEAYAHLSDSKKRKTFDALIQQNRCRKWSCMSEHTSRSPDATRQSNTESLKGKTQSSTGSCYCPFEFHSAEWRMEQEKLRLFRKRAQAKVDALAHILKEGRSRWNEEMQGTLRERYRKASECCKYQRNLCKQSKPERSFSSQSLKELSEFDKASKGGSSSDPKIVSYGFVRSRGNLFTVENRLVHNINTHRTFSKAESQTPQVLHKLRGLLEILKEDMGGSNSEDHATSKHRNFGGDYKVAEGAKGSECGPVGSASPQKTSNKLEELIVIDDFLAGLNQQPPQWAFKNSKDWRKEHTLLRTGNVAESNRSTASCISIGTSQTLAPESDQVEAVQTCSPTSRTKTSVNVNHCGKEPASTCKREEMTLESQKKKSEQLLRMLERLREETQSVVATLKSMKTEACNFPASCHVSTPIAT